MTMIYPWQQTQWQQLTRLIKDDRMPHAMLLLGNRGLGKTAFAASLANAVLCQQPTTDLQACGMCKSCKLMEVNTHPDRYHIRPVAPAKSTSKNPVLNIRIDEIRELCEKLSHTSQMGGYRVAVIEQADYLTVSAANSLLKTLEEPGGNILILLVTARPYRLPVTIRSRCQVMRFSVPDKFLSLDWLQQNNPSQSTPEQLQLALKQAHGSPLAALEYLENTEHYVLLAEAMTASLMGKNPLEYAAKLTNFPKIRTLEAMLGWATDLSRLHSCGPEVEIINEQARDKLLAIARRTNEQRLFRFFDQLNSSLLHSSISLNEQLLWENLLLSWDNL